MDPQRDSLDRLLDEWRIGSVADEDLTLAVRRRIRQREEPSGGWWALLSGERRVVLVAIAGLAALVVGLSVLLVRERGESAAQKQLNQALAQEYLRLIDPMQTGARSQAEFERDLGWLRARLKLSPEQYARIKADHERNGVQLERLAQKAARMKRESAGQEADRRNHNQVDFLAVARLVQEEGEVDRQRQASTEQLVQAVAVEMTPEQRQVYLHYVSGGSAAQRRSPSS